MPDKHVEPNPAHGLGNVIAPARFIAFALLFAAGCAVAIPLLGLRHGLMIAFDIAALVFLASCWPLLESEPVAIREAAKRNDANRAVLLAITAMVTLVMLAIIATELKQMAASQPWPVALIVATLVLAWLFSNAVYTLHYAHMFYSADDRSNDRGGLRFPELDEPGYWDFLYFAFCLGMTFQTSDVDITDRRFRQVATLHCLAAFIFNLGILAFTISVLSG